MARVAIILAREHLDIGIKKLFSLTNCGRDASDPGDFLAQMVDVFLRIESTICNEVGIIIEL
jgi:hypothetical protein